MYAGALGTSKRTRRASSHAEQRSKCTAGIFGYRACGIIPGVSSEPLGYSICWRMYSDGSVVSFAGTEVRLPHLPVVVGVVFRGTSQCSPGCSGARVRAEVHM